MTPAAPGRQADEAAVELVRLLARQAAAEHLRALRGRGERG